jgi:hypothetical protein
MTRKMAVLAPIPSPSIRTAVIVIPGIAAQDAHSLDQVSSKSVKEAGKVERDVRCTDDSVTERDRGMFRSYPWMLPERRGVARSARPSFQATGGSNTRQQQRR